MRINKISKGNWSVEITDEDKKKISCIISKLKKTRELPPFGSWKKMSSEGIWEEILSQFCVMGSARPLEKLVEDKTRYSEFINRVKLKKLFELHANRKDYIAKQLRDFKATRFYNKAAERINDFLETENVVKGNKLVLFKNLEDFSEDKMREILLERQSSFKMKSISDLMIELGASRTFIAFDTRIVGILRKHFGLNIKVDRIQSNENLYKLLEKKLRDICKELNVDLSLLDRILFSNISSIDYILEYEYVPRRM